MFKIKIVIIFLISGLFITGLSHADKPGDADALENVAEGKVVWDITVGNPKKLLVYLKVIEETYDDLVRQDVKPNMVFALRGPVLKLVSSQSLDLELEDEVAHEQVLSLLTSLSQKPGVTMESCSVATRLMGIDNETIIPAVKPVGNTFVSLIGYQQKGYALISIF